MAENGHHDGDVVLSPAKRIKLSHEDADKSDGQLPFYEKRKGVAPIKAEYIYMFLFKTRTSTNQD